MEIRRNRIGFIGWCLAGALLAGCALPHTRVYIPDPALKPDTVLGYQTEQNRHDIRLYPGEPALVEMWVEEAFPFGQLRHSKWMTGPYPFTSDVWFPGGIPMHKGESFGVQVYDGVKVEGGKYREFRRNGWSWTPLEFHARSLCKLRGIEDCWPSEQHGVRGKSDLEPGVVCPVENMAGC
jgi:hypothetical protein